MKDWSDKQTKAIKWKLWFLIVECVVAVIDKIDFLKWHYIEWDQVVEMEWKEIVSVNFPLRSIVDYITIIMKSFILTKRWNLTQKNQVGLKQLKLDNKRNFLPNHLAKRNWRWQLFKITVIQIDLNIAASNEYIDWKHFFPKLNCCNYRRICCQLAKLHLLIGYQFVPCPQIVHKIDKINMMIATENEGIVK